MENINVMLSINTFIITKIERCFQISYGLRPSYKARNSYSLSLTDRSRFLNILIYFLSPHFFLNCGINECCV